MKLLLRALIITLIMGVSLTAIARSPKEEVELAGYRVPAEIDSFLYWRKCGDWNGMYYFQSHNIVLCEENLDLGVPAARFIYLHELGHAYTFQYGMSFLRWGNNYEAAADEWAAVNLVVTGHPTDLLAMAKVFDDWGKQHPQPPGDPHPPAWKRAHRLRELYWAYKIGVGPIGAPWREAYEFWHNQLLHQEAA